MGTYCTCLPFVAMHISAIDLTFFSKSNVHKKPITGQFSFLPFVAMHFSDETNVFFLSHFLEKNRLLFNLHFQRLYHCTFLIH
jgi:hypothetical protein